MSFKSEQELLNQQLAKPIASKTLEQLEGDSLVDMFTKACEVGEVEPLELMKTSLQTDVFNQIIVKSQDECASFLSAAMNGHLNVLKWFRNQKKENIRFGENAGFIDLVFSMAAGQGKIDVIKWLLETDVINWVQEFIKAPWRFDPKSHFYSFESAVRHGHQEIALLLLEYPSIFGSAEKHDHEYGEKFIYPFIQVQIKKIDEQKKLFLHQNPSAEFNLSDTNTTRLCWYMIRNLIRRNDRQLVDDLRFLISIPTVRELAHQAITINDEPNELLRLAQTLDNADAATTLLGIDAVRREAEAHNFYVSEQNGQLDLQQLARNNESSLIGLTTEEEARLKDVKNHYKYKLEQKTTNDWMDELKETLKKRYIKNPATVLINGKSVSLPVDWSMFQNLNLQGDNLKNALTAYYQNKNHTALRYLSIPNPWINPNALYINTNTQGSHAIFRGLEELIILLWTAASDEQEKPIDGMTLEGRINNFIDVLAQLGRAHNWDNSRTNTLSGESEEYDNLEKDKPSCYSGIKRRVFCSVVGHRLLNLVSVQKIQIEVNEFIREHLIAKINQSVEQNKPLAKAVNDYFINLDDLEKESSVLLESCNISEKEQTEFIVGLKKKYGKLFNTSLEAYTKTNFKLDPPYHLLKFYQTVGIDKTPFGMSVSKFNEETNIQTNENLNSSNSNAFFKEANTTPKMNREELIKQLDEYIEQRSIEWWTYHYNFLGIVAILYYIQDCVYGTDYSTTKSQQAKLNAATHLKESLESGDTSKLTPNDIKSLQDGRISKIANQCIEFTNDEQKDRTEQKIKSH